ncbi:MAG: hypothetical protein A2X86_20295 [Bdellovibrionales bacterium GWA2_49_15]|nr:MAG: hypothetical protein A2X86_20295 [Bdellovibrionales bacterium GWA2_49_15]HAZ11345.1 hypothetical protein [Bdellovibrionales bacterium]
MNKTIVLDFLKKNWLALTSTLFALLALIFSLGFNAKILEEKFLVKIKEEVKKETNRNMDNLAQDSRAFAKEELGKVETKLAEIEKSLSDLKAVLTDSDLRASDLSARVADLQTKSDALEQKLNKRPAPAAPAPKTAHPIKKKK